MSRKPLTVAQLSERRPVTIVTTTPQIAPLVTLWDWHMTHHVGASEDTRKAKEQDFKELMIGLEWLKKQRVKTLTFEDVQLKDLETLAARWMSDGFAVSTVNRRIYTIKFFFKMCGEQLGRPSPALRLKCYRHDRTRFKGIANEDLHEILTAAESVGRTEYEQSKNKLAFLSTFGSGLRRDEVRNLLCGQYHDGIFTNVVCKGKRVRDVSLHERIRPLLCEFIDQNFQELKRRYPGQGRTLIQNAPYYPIFMSFKNADPRDPASFLISYRHFGRIFTKIGEAANVHLHAHKLRHTFARLLLDVSDLRTVQQALGHSSPVTTALYTETTTEQIEAQIRKIGIWEK